MTKLQEWLTVLTVIAGLWLSAYNKMWGTAYRMEILWTPVMMVVLLGIYSVLTIAYRVATFNDCEEASLELQKQIGEARADLRSKGFDFDQ